MKSNTLYIDLHYLPCLAYFTTVLAYEEIALAMYEPYQKQSYSNRCYIRSAQQVDRLTVPVLGGKKKKPYAAIEIDQKQRWAQTHWRSICTNYGKAPYFAYMAPYFEPILFAQHTYLHELSLALFTLLPRPVTNQENHHPRNRSAIHRCGRRTCHPSHPSQKGKRVKR